MEVCNASGVNFAVMCTAIIDMAMKTLFRENKISKGGTYKDEGYFDLSKEDTRRETKEG